MSVRASPATLRYYDPSPPSVLVSTLRVVGFRSCGCACVRMCVPPTPSRPVRKPRPVAEKLPGKTALITGQRVLDVLFP